MKGNLNLQISALFIFGIVAGQIWYTTATVEQLKWLLYPTGYLLSWFLNETPVLTADGYLFNETNIILGKTCSGFTFLLLFCSLFAFNFNKYYTTGFKKMLFVVVICLLSYPVTLLINTSRILAGMFGQQLGNIFLINQPHRVLHEFIGLFCYMAALLIAYKLFNNHHTKSFPNEKQVPS